jgi:hypothetical protein
MRLKFLSVLKHLFYLCPAFSIFFTFKYFHFMKNNSFLLIACTLFVFACQNDPKPATTPETPAPGEKIGAPAPQVDLGVLNQSVSDAKSNLTEIDKVNQEINKLPASVQKANKAIIESVRGELYGIEEKQRIMLTSLETYVKVNTPSTSTNLADKTTVSDNQIISEAEVKDILQSIPQYRANCEAALQQIQALAKGQK